MLLDGQLHVARQYPRARRKEDFRIGFGGVVHARQTMLGPGLAQIAQEGGRECRLEPTGRPLGFPLVPGGNGRPRAATSFIMRYLAVVCCYCWVRRGAVSPLVVGPSRTH